MHVATTAGVSPESHARLEGLSAEVVTAERDFLELEPAWNRLVRDAGIDHPFLTHAWVLTCPGSPSARTSGSAWSS